LPCERHVVSGGFDIGGRHVGVDSPVLIVAELSANHGGKLDVALRTIEAAAKAGVDAIKLQTYTPDTLTLRSSAAPFVVRTNNEWAGRTLHDLYAEAMTPWQWHADLFACAKANGLLLFSTPFDPTATELLESLNAPAHKIASFELVDLPLVEHVARRGKPLLISTGMASLGEIEAAVRVCRAAGNERIALLRCVSNYPADPDDLHLESLRVLADLAPVIGLSDHTRSAYAAVAAVALGAKVVEKHFILDRSVGGPDAFFSLEPTELEELVRAIRATEGAVRAPRFGPSARETPSLNFRRSLFVSSDVRAGDTLTANHVRSVRPAGGLHPRHLPEVLGHVATKDLLAGSPLDWTIVGEPARNRVCLRPAVPGDEARLLEWRNDVHTSEMSLQRATVTASEHALWFASALASPDRKLFIAEYENRAVGQLRLDRRAHGAWEVSLTIAPESRGRGLGADTIRAAFTHAIAAGAAVLIATIRAENPASVVAFERAGFYGFFKRTQGELQTIHCERRLVPFP
jgi:pseudaminic acid synthase